MRNLKFISLLVLPLLGCFAQIESNGITMTHNLCGGTTNCMPGGVPLGLVQVSGQNTFTVSFGDQPLLQPSSQLGPTTLKTSLLLNDAAFNLQAQANANFSGVATISLLAAINPPSTPGGDPCATASNCTVVADYDRTRDGVADQRIVLRGRGIDLVNLINQTSHNLTLQIQATGTAPTPSWNADVSMDMALKSRANLP
jgi:hypothetical protein